MNDFVVRYNRPTTELEKSIMNNQEYINDSKWFSNYKRAENFAIKNNSKVQNGFEYINKSRGKKWEQEI